MAATKRAQFISVYSHRTSVRLFHLHEEALRNLRHKQTKAKVDSSSIEFVCTSLVIPPNRATSKLKVSSMRNTSR